MLFRTSPWDFHKKLDKMLPQATGPKHQLGGFIFSDSFLEKYMLDVFYRCYGGKEKFRFYYGDDLDEVWVENNLLARDFFSLQEPFFIQQAHQLSSKVSDLIVNQKEKLEVEAVYFSFLQNNAFCKKLQKIDGVPFVQVETPRFWEMNRYMIFLQEDLGIQVSREGIELILEYVPNTPYRIFQALEQLKLEVQKTDDSVVINERIVKECLGRSNWDYFLLTKLFLSRNFRAFFNDLGNGGIGQYEELRGLFAFIQGQLIKLLQLKSTKINDLKIVQTKFVKDLMKFSNLWAPNEIYRSMHQLALWELMAKRKDSFLDQEIRCKNLRISS